MDERNSRGRDGKGNLLDSVESGEPCVGVEVTDLADNPKWILSNLSRRVLEQLQRHAFFSLQPQLSKQSTWPSVFYIAISA